MGSGVMATSAPCAGTDREQQLDAAAAGVVLKPEPCQALDQAGADTLLLRDLRRLLRTVAARRSAAAAGTVRPLDVLAGLMERLRAELEAEAAVPPARNRE